LTHRDIFIPPPFLRIGRPRLGLLIPSAFARRSLLFLFLLSLSEGCSPSRDESFGDEIDHSALQPRTLVGTVLSEAPAIGSPLDLNVSGDYLWVSDGLGDPGLHVLDATTGELLHSLGRKGEGPGEFGNAPGSLEVFQSDPGAVWAWDMRLQRLTRFEPRPISEFEFQILRLDGPRVRRVAWPRADHLIGVAMSQDERFTIFGQDGRAERSIPGPILGGDDIPMAARLNATDGPSKVCTWPDHGFAILNFFVGRVELYDLDAQFVRLAQAPFRSEVAFEFLEGGRVQHVTSRAWYYDCAAHDENLFALFSGRLRSAFEGDERFSGRYVHVFGWDGNLKGVLQLDHDIRGIALGESGSVLFASSLVDSKIYRYEIPEFSW